MLTNLLPGQETCSDSDTVTRTSGSLKRPAACGWEPGEDRKGDSGGGGGLPAGRGRQLKEGRKNKRRKRQRMKEGVKPLRISPALPLHRFGNSTERGSERGPSFLRILNGLGQAELVPRAIRHSALRTDEATLRLCPLMSSPSKAAERGRERKRCLKRVPAASFADDQTSIH